MRDFRMRVLLVEDSDHDADILRFTLSHSGDADAFSIVRTRSLAEALVALRDGQFGAILSDLGLQDSSGVGTVRALVAAAPDTPVIVLTGSESEDEEATAMHAGAQDYLVKSASGGTLVARAIRHAVERQRLTQALHDANTGLHAANRELEAFSYSVSHDLRAPLRAIDGFSAMLAEDFGRILPPQGLEYLGHVRNAAHKMGDIVTALLTLSRLDNADMERGECSMEHLVRECLEELAPALEDRQVNIEVGRLPDCQANRSLLRQVVCNLLSNALKYSRGRDPARIEVGSESLDGETVYFVRDNGAGFDMAHAGKLFGVFQRLHRPEDFEGTGVGLAIVQRIVHRHGGHVWAEAAPGAGATFRFTLGAAG
jgi:signal transduction histidine kinase